MLIIDGAAFMIVKKEFEQYHEILVLVRVCAARTHHDKTWMKGPD